VKIDWHTHTRTSSDVTHKQLARIPLAEHRFEEFDTGLYSAEFYRQTYDTMLAIEYSVRHVRQRIGEES
jgi:predicted kinase